MTMHPIAPMAINVRLIGNSADVLKEHLRQVLDGNYKSASCPALWDGRAAERIAEILANLTVPAGSA